MKIPPPPQFDKSYSAETKAKFSKFLKETNLSAETKAKFSGSLKETNLSAETRSKMSVAQGTPIFRYDLKSH